MDLHNQIDRKFIEEFDVSDWEIETDTGWHDISSIKKTIPYEVWNIETQSGLTLSAADNHIIFDGHYNEIFVKDCQPNETKIITEHGIDVIGNVERTNQAEHMFDVTVDSDYHRYYSNGILSHNTTCAAGYLLWKAMFTADSTILVAAHQYSGAAEIMQRIRYAYEETPDFLRAGVIEYNKGSITFDNGSRIISQATTEKTGRGLSLSLIYLDEFAFVEPRMAQEFWTSLSPTLSTGGSCIITSTPNSETDQFAEIWREANNTIDEYGNERPDGLGVNDFKAFTVDYKQIPGRDEEFERKMKAQLGEERFAREFMCLTGDTMLTLKNKQGEIFDLSISDLYGTL